MCNCKNLGKEKNILFYFVNLILGEIFLICA